MYRERVGDCLYRFVSVCQDLGDQIAEHRRHMFERSKQSCINTQRESLDPYYVTISRHHTLGTAHTTP